MIKIVLTYMKILNISKQTIGDILYIWYKLFIIDIFQIQLLLKYNIEIGYFKPYI